MGASKKTRKLVPHDGNSATAHVAYATNEIIAIYPITPSSTMGEIADERASSGQKNIWGMRPKVIEMQSEAGAAGAVHGALTTGSLSTTFTSSQGLLLMIPNMYKIAGELTPTVFHVAARSIATQALSIFGDHSDVMAIRATGFAMLCACNAQEAMDFSLIAQRATLESRVPFMHFFDGFRTSHEIQKIEELDFDDMRHMIDESFVIEHRSRGLSPEHPTIRGTSQNTDVFFQSRETVNRFYERVPQIVKNSFEKFSALTGRNYQPFDYVGSKQAEYVVVMMGSGCETMHELVEELTQKNEKIGLIKVRLYRPFSVDDFISALPSTVKKIAVLDRTKEPGSSGEPLYLDVQNTICEAINTGVYKGNNRPEVFGGRYGLGSKCFNTGMAKSVFDNLTKEKPINHFTVGIIDDLSNKSLAWDNSFHVNHKNIYQAMFFGLGGDGTVSANKNSIKIVANATDQYTQGYFVYDSKKAGAITISHLRFSTKPIRCTYLVQKSEFISCHKFAFINSFEILQKLKKGGIFLLNSPFKAESVWSELPVQVQKALIKRQAKFFVIDANALASSLGLGERINIIMQAAFFDITKIMPPKQALDLMAEAIEKTYARKGNSVVEKNLQALKLAGEKLEKVVLRKTANSQKNIELSIPKNAPKFVQQVTKQMLAQDGDHIPTSALPCDGTYPIGTTKYEKRNMAKEIPSWISEACIQCNKCVFVCPHAAIRAKVFNPEHGSGQKPANWQTLPAKGREFKGMLYTLQVAPEDCTGCENCVHVCPAFVKDSLGVKTNQKSINMEPIASLREQEIAKWDYFLSLPDIDHKLLNRFTPKESQLLPPMFEFSGACSGCGETPYIKLMTQLFGDQMLIANATGCSSIYGGNLPTTPYCSRFDGRGPAWSNSLFEDNAEFGLGMRLSVDEKTTFAKELLFSLNKKLKKSLAEKILRADVVEPHEMTEQRERVLRLKSVLAQINTNESKRLLSVADYLVPQSVWIVGGDGWAYDIGFGGLDHVLASGNNVNVLVLDTQVYSNTGGQASKATPRAARAKFATSGKAQAKKDLGTIAICYQNVYVAQIAYGANMAQTVKAFKEAHAYDGPSIIIAYCQCIEHGIDMTKGTDSHIAAERSGFWPLYRYNPDLKLVGKNPLVLDSKNPTQSVDEFISSQNRFRTLKVVDQTPKIDLSAALCDDLKSRWNWLQTMASGAQK